MRYIDEKHLEDIKPSWLQLIETIEKAAYSLKISDYAQPLKPYLRFGNPKNRIIAMPAYVGSEINAVGIKWVSSYPDNIFRGMNRAHSVLILNNPDTGAPIAMMNSSKVSIIRTAAVSGSMVKSYLKARKSQNIRLGIIGLGPIGEAHYHLMQELLGDLVDQVLVYDQLESRNNDFLTKYKDKKNLHLANGWEEIISNSNIVITCTVANAPYIDLPPLPGSLHLNISLRDYKSCIFPYVKEGIVVDNWEEVCREGTNIQQFSMENGLCKEEVMTLDQVIFQDSLSTISSEAVIMFNPMGMAVFDIAIGKLLFDIAERNQLGVVLDS